MTNKDEKEIQESVEQEIKKTTSIDDVSNLEKEDTKKRKKKNDSEEELTPEEKEEQAKKERDMYITKLCADRALEQMQEETPLPEEIVQEEAVSEEAVLENLTFAQRMKKHMEQAKVNWNDPTKKMVRNRRALEIFGTIFRTFILIGLCFVILLPVLQKVSYAIRAPQDISNQQVVWIPEHWSLMNVKIAYTYLTINSNTTFLNSIFLSAICMVIQIMATAVAGYAFARLKVKYFSNIFFYLVILTLVVPNESLTIARSLFFQDTPFFFVNLISNVFAMFIMSAFGMGLRSAIFIYLFRQFFRGVPIELEESAEVDGAGVIRTFWSVMLPNARGAIVTVGLFSFVWQYNDFYYATLYKFNDPKVLPLLTTSLAGSVSQFRSMFETSFRTLINELGETIARDDKFYGLILNTGALLMMLPLIIAYFFVQRLFVESIERTGITGM